MGAARFVAPFLLAVLATAACDRGGGGPLAPEQPTPRSAGFGPRIASPAPASEVPVLVGAGDIADCASPGDDWTADLLDDVEGTVVTMGDNVYPNGSTRDFTECYHPTWGRHLDRSLPSVGNHEYLTPLAAGYFEYFGERAGTPGLGFYSYDLAGWHVVVLNSMLEYVDHAGQRAWLTQDLARNRALCTVAYFHHPRFSSGTSHGDQLQMAAIWTILYRFGVDVVLAGHDHHYERWAPQDELGRRDERYGIRQFIVGIGGRSLRGYTDGRPNSEYRYNGSFGVLKLSLEPDGYRWELLATDGATMWTEDSGADTCHGRPHPG